MYPVNGEKNQSNLGEFFLCGLLGQSDFDMLLCILFTVVYIASLFGNFIIIFTTTLCSSLQTPMYFFLTNLSLLDICCISTTVPKMLYNYATASFSITYNECAMQLYIFTWLEITELLLLTYMAFDRYVAICKPLHYSVIITKTTCFRASITVWSLGGFSSAVHTSVTFSLSFCDTRNINHFFCEIPPLLKISCTDTSVNQMLTFLTDLILGILCFLFIFISYVFIISSISQIRSVESKRRASSICTSHILVVLFYYGTLFLAYIKPQVGFFVNQDKILSVIYAIFIPLLNPVIYTLRNKDVTEALIKISKMIYDIKY